MRKIYLIFTFLFLHLVLKAQQLPIYTQYFNNPYIYNPAFAGTQNAAFVWLNHRQQWRGIEGAPVTSNFTFHTPVGRRAALGVNLNTDKRGLLTTSTALASFGYTVPFGYNHFLRFGISAGMGSNAIDFAQVDNIQDPAVLRLLSENIFLDGQFGVNYQIKNFNLGFALPKLYETAIFSEDYFSELQLGRLKRYLFTGSYKINVGPTSYLEPLAIYRMTEGLPDYIEGGLVLNLRDIIWFGGSYRKDYGASAFGGIKIKDHLNIGYAYEIATSQVSTFVSGTHELQIGIRLGKYKDPNRKKAPREKIEPIVKEIEEPKIQEEKIVDEVPEQPPVEIVKEIPKEKEPERIIEQPVQIPIETAPIQVVVSKGKHPLELDKGHYAITGVFSNERNAQKYSNELKGKGHTTKYGYNSDNNYYYVYIYNSEEKSETLDEILRLRKQPDFKDIWLLSVENTIENSPAEPLKEAKPREIKETKGPKPTDIRNAPTLHETPVNFIVDEDQILNVKKGTHDMEMEEGYYVIAAVFKEQDKAEKYNEMLYQEGFYCKLGYNSDKKYFFLYLSHSNTEDKAKKDRNRFVQNKLFKDSWILLVE